MKEYYLFILLFTLTTINYGQDIYQVEMGSFGNVINLRIANPLDDELSNVVVRAIKFPEWIEFMENSIIINKLENNSATKVKFIFNVKNISGLTQTAELTFGITDKSGRSWMKCINIAINLPTKFELTQNYPNPFNPSTMINYSIASESLVKLVVFNSIGEEVITLVNELKQPGNYSNNFDASSLSSGVYFYKLTAGDFVSTKKMLFLK